MSDNAVFSQGNPATPVSVNHLNTMVSIMHKLPVDHISAVSTMPASI